MYKAHMQQAENVGKSFLPASFTNLDLLLSHSVFTVWTQVLEEIKDSFQENGCCSPLSIFLNAFQRCNLDMYLANGSGKS